MIKISRIPLIMADGYPAKSLEELREHFSLEKVLEAYYKDGQLINWLDSRGLEDELDKVRALEEKAPDFAIRLCKIFQVEYTGEQPDPEAIRMRLERLERLKDVTDEPEYHKNIDCVAFSQEELAELVLDKGESAVYLCQEEGTSFTFTIPSSFGGVTYEGISCKGAKPKVRVTRKAWDRWKELNIKVLNCDVEEPAQPESDELEQKRQEPVWSFLESVFQKEERTPEEEANAEILMVGIKGGMRFQKESIQGNREELKKKITLLVQEALAEENERGKESFIAGMELMVGEEVCRLLIQPESVARGQVKGVHISRGNDGARTIQVELVKPVKINGRNYRNISVLSADIYEKLDLREGSEIELSGLGELMPGIRVYERGDGRTLRCPYCDSRYQIRDGQLFCENPVCYDRLHGRISRFLAELGLESYDPVFVQTLLEKLPVRSFKDLLKVDDSLLDEYGITDEKFRQFPETLRKTIAGVPASRILGKLGIPGLGVKRARMVMEVYRRFALSRELSPWECLLQSFDDSLWDERMDEVLDPKTSAEIQRWLRYDCRSMKIFREDMAAFQEYVNKDAEESVEDNIGNKASWADNSISHRLDLKIRKEIKKLFIYGTRVGVDQSIYYKDIKDIFLKNGFQYIEITLNSLNAACHGGVDVAIVPSLDYTSFIFCNLMDYHIPVFTLDELLETFQK